MCVCGYCRGVVEYDAEGFTKLTLLLMWKDFCFLVHGRKVTKHADLIAYSDYSDL